MINLNILSIKLDNSYIIRSFQSDFNSKPKL